MVPTSMGVQGMRDRMWLHKLLLKQKRQVEMTLLV
jgi:hypothetical protein